MITRHGKPIARLVPCEEPVPPLFGCLGETVQIKGDVIAPLDETWNA